MTETLLVGDPAGNVLASLDLVSFPLQAEQQIFKVGGGGDQPVDGSFQLRLIAGPGLGRLVLDVALSLVLSGDDSCLCGWSIQTHISRPGFLLQAPSRSHGLPPASPPQAQTPGSDGGQLRSERFDIRGVGVDNKPVNRHLAEIGAIAPGGELRHLLVNEALFFLSHIKFHLDIAFSVRHAPTLFFIRVWDYPNKHYFIFGQGT